ncbi:MAG: ferrochelatase [Desulfobacterota bacterium]|nr:ferrochelatase [Thermodesulfobacteriota bacterium]
MKALLLMAFGSPRSPEDADSFLARLLGRTPPSALVERVKEKYRLIGGESPLLAITEQQAKALEEKLNARGHPLRSYVGMLYSEPLIEETLRGILRDGFEEVVALPMTPFRSRYTTGAYREALGQANRLLGNRLNLTVVEGWHLHPLFLQSISERIEEGLTPYGLEERRKVHLLFTAHSLPESVAGEDPYVSDMVQSVKGVLNRLGPVSWHLAFQSRGGGPGRWLGPDVETVLVELKRIGVRDVLLVPIGFVSDHIEVLYDIDRVYREKAGSFGMRLRRTQSLNCSETFLEALALAIEKTLGSSDGKNPRIQTEKDAS